MEAAGETVYDTVTYPSRCKRQTHPDHLAMLATLFGMAPTPANACRTLELGCGDGWNLIPMAFAHPAAQFVGVDLAPSAIARATEDAKSLGLSNVEFHCRDLLDWTPPGGQFDYIIAHGLFSWVPETVRHCVLELCRDRLAAQGVAYISYNALPGCHIRGMLREMMLFHTRNTGDPVQKIGQAKEFLQLLSAGRVTENSLTAILRDEVKRVLERDADAVLFHDDLASINQPFYFHEFAALAGKCGLQYLAEANFFDMQVPTNSPTVIETLRQLNDDVILKEQYLDFLKCRRFRQTLLCRADVKLNREHSPVDVRRFLIASDATPKSSQPNMKAGVPEEFANRSGSVRVSDPLAKASIVELSAYWPRAYTFDELMLALHRRLGLPLSESFAREGPLSEIILAGFSAGIIELHLQQPNWEVKKGKRPVLSPLVRYQLMNNRELMTSLRGVNISADSMLRATYHLMDGSRNNAAITSELRRLVDSGELTLPEGGSRQQLGPEVDRIVREAAKAGMLITWDDSSS